MVLNFLKTGDYVDVIAPGYAVTKEEIKQAAAYLKSVGLRMNVPSNLVGEDLFCSNSAENRFKHLRNAIENKKSKAIWCLRGGYGAVQLIPYLERIKKPKKEKFFIGFSDATALHIFFNQRWGWKTIHGTTLTLITDEKVSAKSSDSLVAMLFGRKHSTILSDLKQLNKIKVSGGEIKSRIVGGNLSLIQTSLGTGWQLDTRNKILLLEDTDEKSYSYDRMLMHIVQAGLVEQSNAVILGDFQHNKDENKRIKAMLARFAENADVPVFKTDLVGHGKNNLPILLGANAVLSLGKNPALKIDFK